MSKIKIDADYIKFTGHNVKAMKKFFTKYDIKYHYMFENNEHLFYLSGLVEVNDIIYYLEEPINDWLHTGDDL